MDSKMIQIVQNRIDELVKNKDVQKIMLGFDSTEKAHEWVTKAAIATLIIPQNER